MYSKKYTFTTDVWADSEREAWEILIENLKYIVNTSHNRPRYDLDEEIELATDEFIIELPE